MKRLQNDKQEETYEESTDLTPNNNEEQQEEKIQDNSTNEKEEVTEEPVALSRISGFSSNGTNSTYELKNTDEFVLKIVSTGETWVNITNSNGNLYIKELLKVEQKVRRLIVSRDRSNCISMGNLQILKYM